MKPTNAQIGKIMTITEVEDAVLFKKTKIYRMIDAGQFPPQKRYGGSSKWWSTQIEYFLVFQSWNEEKWAAWVAKENTASEAA